MPYFGSKSLIKISHCHWDLQRVAQEAIKEIDFSIICGYREKQLQDFAYENKRSKLRWPDSKHNSYPSRAFDFIPWPFRSWEELNDFNTVANVIVNVAAKLDIEITGGFDWGWDLGHIELKS